MHYLVVGVNGVGKSTLLKEMSQRTGIPVLHATQVLVDYMGMPLDYARLRAMDQDFTMKQWEAAAAELARIYKDKPYFLDAHILNLIEGKISSRAGPWAGLQDAMVMLRANPVTILQRLNADSSRNRDLFSPGLGPEHQLAIIEDHQDQMEKLFHQLAVQYELPNQVISIENLQDAVAAFQQFIRGIPQ